LLALLQSLSPTAADLGISVLDPNTGIPVPLASADIDNVPGLGESTTTTWEIGYEAVLGGRLRLAADAWHSTRRDFISPLVLRSPLLLLEGESIGAFIAGPWVQRRVQELVTGGADPAAALEQAQAEAAVVVPAVATALGSVPVGVVSSAEVDASAADLLVTYVNVGEVDLWGADLSFRWFVDDRWSVGGAVSMVSDDWFEIADGAPIALNAPRRKGSLDVARRAGGLDVEARFRFAEGFPVSSAELVGTSCVTGESAGIFEEGCVEAMALFDLTASWAVPNSRAVVQLSVSDLFDRGYRGFVGVPEIGRLALIGVRYTM
jgi:outer membrane receptor protein involved in Fe transport